MRRARPGGPVDDRDRPGRGGHDRGALRLRRARRARRRGRRRASLHGEGVEEQRGELATPPHVEEVVGGGAGREVAGEASGQRAEDQRRVEVAGVVRDDDEAALDPLEPVAADDRDARDRPDRRLEHDALGDVAGHRVAARVEAVLHVGRRPGHGVASALVRRGVALLGRGALLGPSPGVVAGRGHPVVARRVGSSAFRHGHCPAASRASTRWRPRPPRTALRGAWRTKPISTLYRSVGMEITLPLVDVAQARGHKLFGVEPQEVGYGRRPDAGALVELGADPARARAP